LNASRTAQGEALHLEIVPASAWMAVLAVEGSHGAGDGVAAWALLESSTGCAGEALHLGIVSALAWVAVFVIEGSHGAGDGVAA
jgi:hypothetical protein